MARLRRRRLPRGMRVVHAAGAAARQGRARRPARAERASGDDARAARAQRRRARGRAHRVHAPTGQFHCARADAAAADALPCARLSSRAPTLPTGRAGRDALAPLLFAREHDAVLGCARRGARVERWLRYAALRDDDDIAAVPHGLSAHVRRRWECPRCRTTMVVGLDELRDHLASCQCTASAPPAEPTAPRMPAPNTESGGTCDAPSRPIESVRDAAPPPKRRRLGTSVVGKW